MRIIFLSYLPRSGSSYIMNELSKHNNIIACPESGIIQKLLLTRPNSNYQFDIKRIKGINLQNEILKLAKWNLELSKFKEFNIKQKNIDVFYEILKKNNPDFSDKIFIYKHFNAINTYNQLSKDKNYHGQIFLLCLIRDPRAIFSSQKYTSIPNKNAPFNINPLVTANKWNYLIKRFINTLEKDHIYLIKYEDFMKNKKKCIEEIQMRIALNFGRMSKQGDYADKIPDQIKIIHPNVEKEPIVDRIDSWESQINIIPIKLIEKITGLYMSKFNYVPITKNYNILAYYISLLYFKFRILFKFDKY